MTGYFNPLFVNISDLLWFIGIVAATVVLLFAVWKK